MNDRPIVIVEDDLDDCDILKNVLLEIGVANELRCFVNGVQALEYLIITLEKPFLILSDINMPFMDGLELKQQIDQNSFLKSLNIPFIFLTTSSNHDSVKRAFKLSIQGYFVKPNTYDEYKVLLKLVTGYWGNSVEPI